MTVLLRGRAPRGWPRGAVAAVALLAAACSRPAPHAPPPSEVAVLTVEPRTVAADYDYVGQAAASKRVEVRAQVSGIIVARPYLEGSEVRRGTLLFKIDPTPYEAAYRSALAQLATARAQRDNAERNLARLEPLLTVHAVAQRDVDDARTAAEQARAAVQAAQAAVVTAKKNLDDTDVRAEITGRVGRAQMVLGALVRGPTDLLTTIDQLDPIYVNFNPSDQDVLAWRRGVADKRLSIPHGVLRVRATLSDGSLYPLTGKLNFVDLAVQEQTGTMQLRAEFPNPQHTLLPGQFLRVSLQGIQRHGVMLVPQRAVQQGLTGPYVYVVDSAGQAAQRPVAASVWHGTEWVVDSGLAPGDRVVVDGVQKIMPGVPVRAVAYKPPPAPGGEAGTDTIPIAAPGIPLRTRP